MTRSTSRGVRHVLIGTIAVGTLFLVLFASLMVAATASALREAAPDIPSAGEFDGEGTGGFGRVNANGWAWPTGTKSINQGFHSGGLWVDLGSAAGGPLYSPYDGVVTSTDRLTFIPGVCRANPSWWRGPNQIIRIRHVYKGQTIYSQHHHMATGSPAKYGLRPGARVKAGQQVGNEGMTGCTSGPHVHFGLGTSDSYMSNIDPFIYIGRP